MPPRATMTLRNVGRFSLPPGLNPETPGLRAQAKAASNVGEIPPQRSQRLRKPTLKQHEISKRWTISDLIFNTHVRFLDEEQREKQVQNTQKAKQAEARKNKAAQQAAVSQGLSISYYLFFF